MCMRTLLHGQRTVYMYYVKEDEVYVYAYTGTWTADCIHVLCIGG